MVGPLIDLGHTVVGCGRSAAGVESLRQEHESPGRFDVVDVAVSSQVDEWARSVVEQAGPPDLVINNAALMNRNAPLWEISDEEFTELMQVNVIGTVNVIRAFLPSMIERGAGVVVNMSSGWGRITAPEVAPYCASKWAVEGLTRALADELPPGLAAVAVSPGVVDTDMLRSCWGGAAGSSPKPEQWSTKAVPLFLALNASHNGRSLTFQATA
jgi:NAD(P)-dependent dehydrogenase (short-subunit alcohol dehydrogenase family)